jgi:DNA helicase II / ATP-dependent DNA helicase PcrA
VLLEDALIPFREIPPVIRFTAADRNEQDLIRLYYVAYSRAKYALVHLVPANQEGPTTGFISNSPGKFREFVVEVV